MVYMYNGITVYRYNGVNGGMSMFDKTLVTWKVCAIMPIAIIGEAIYRICDFTIERVLYPMAGSLHRWCLKDEYKRG